MSLQLVSASKCYDGEQRVYCHESDTLGCEMKFGVYLPSRALNKSAPTACPVVFYLSGLTCTHENFIQKSGMQQHASKYGIIVVNPDTSPRNLNIPGEDDSYDFGSGAGFYINATVSPWSKNYHMYSYVTKELNELIDKNFSVLPNKRGIFGHSMGGHGALICALKNPGLYQSVSAFAPIANPMECPWGQKAFKGYIGDDDTAWKQWDATQLSSEYVGPQLEIFIDQGSNDDFLKMKQLLPENFINKAKENKHLNVIYNLRDGYDHSYYYIMSFIGEHVAYHAKMLS